LTSQGIATSPQGGGEGADDGAKRAAEEQLRRDVLATLLDPAARERLSRIALVSPERSRHIEEILLRLMQSGQLRGRVSEQQLIELLEQADEAQSKSKSTKPSISFKRRKDPDDDWDI